MDPPSPDSVPGVTPSGSEGESLPSSDAGTAIVAPSPQAGAIQQARLQLGVPGASTPRAGGSTPTPDSGEADDVEAFRAEVESLKARYMVCHSAGVPSFLVVLTPLLQRLAQSARAKDLALRQVTEDSARVRSLQGDLDNEREVNKGLMGRVADLTNQLNAEKQRNQGDNPSVCCCYFDFSK